MHTRKSARYGARAGPGNKHSVPAEWQLVLWLGIVALAVGLVVLTPQIKDDVQGLAPTERTGSQELDTGESMAAPCAQTVPLSAGMANRAEPRVEPGADAPSIPAYTPH